MISFNVYSAKIKITDKDGSVKRTGKFIYTKSVPTIKYGIQSTKSVVDPQIHRARDTKGLMRQMLKQLKHKSKAGEYYVLQVKTTKGQYYFSNIVK